MSAARVVAWVIFGMVTLLGAALLARWVLGIPPGRRRWLALDGAVLALLAPVDLAVYVLSGGGFFWPAISIGVLSVVLGAHVWWVSSRPDPDVDRLTEKVLSLTRTRRRAVDAQADELRRIERDLHDGAQARLVSVALDLAQADSVLRSDPEEAERMLRDARRSVGTALEELRAVMQGIRPGVLADRGLVEGVRALAIDLAVPVTVSGPVPALPVAVEQAAYFAVTEALANVVKHARAETAWVEFGSLPDGVRIIVRDDGCGGADPSRGTGLRGIADRLAPLDGTVDVVSPAGGPTEVTISLPTGG